MKAVTFATELANVVLNTFALWLAVRTGDRRPFPRVRCPRRRAGSCV